MILEDGTEGLMECCGSEHLFEKHRVRQHWWPEKIRCLIIGENPGVPGSRYFYEPIPKFSCDPIEVRRYLLPALAQAKLITEATLESFRDGGFLFDHAIRCQLVKDIKDMEWKLARKSASPLAHKATHLRPIIGQAAKVWVMGYIARDAVTYPDAVHTGSLTPPYVVDEKFFSEYLNRHTYRVGDLQRIVNRFIEFFNA